MPQSDEELVIKALAGDIDSFGQLVQKYQGAVLGLAFNLVENFTDAQDIAQEAFIKSFQNLDQLKDYKKFAHWLNQITASQIVSDISNGFDILGVWEIFPSFTIITEDGLKHTWLLTHIGRLTRESRLVWLFTTGLFWRGGAYQFFLTNEQINVYLDVSRKLGYEIDSENFRRRIDAHHLFWFLENYSWLVKQAEEPGKDERFVEWAKLHGTAKERMESMKSSFFESPLLSNDKTYVKFRAILERYL